MQVDSSSKATVPPIPGQPTQALTEVINLKLLQRPEQQSTCNVPNGTNTAQTTSPLRIEPLRDPLSELPLNHLPLDIAKEAMNEDSGAPIFSPLRDEHFGFGLAAKCSTSAEVRKGRLEIYPEKPLKNSFNTQSQGEVHRKETQDFLIFSEKRSKSASEEIHGGARDAPAISVVEHGLAGSTSDELKVQEASAKSSSLVTYTSSSSVEVGAIELSRANCSM